MDFAIKDPPAKIDLGLNDVTKEARFFYFSQLVQAGLKQFVLHRTILELQSFSHACKFKCFVKRFCDRLF